MQAEIQDIVGKSLEKAREHDAQGNVGRAYAYYTLVIELCSAKRAEVEKVFTDVLCEWGMRLALDNRINDVVRCYEHSLDIYPKNTRMLSNFAAHLLRNGNPMRTIEYSKLALQTDPDFLPAERNLQNAYSMAVDRWHFSMLNDRNRNRAFREAIRRRVSQGYDTVLDIGTGTGLLSLYAREAGARKVYACDCSPVMANIAKTVLVKNNAEEVKLFPEFSSNLNVPKDIPERVRLIVTETFDAGLFGELVVPTVIDAHKNLLSENGSGMVIPMCASLHIAVVESDHIRSRSTIIFNKSDHPSLLNFDNISILPDDEFYDTVDLENVNVNYITEPKEILRVDFNNLVELRAFSEDGEKGCINVKCRYDGTIDGLVAWFRLYLDEETVLDSSQGKSCWQQAIFPMVPRICKQEDNLTIHAKLLCGKLKCSYNSGKFVSSEERRILHRVPREVIAFLNDFDYVMSLVVLAKSRKEDIIRCVLDTSPFPVYGLTLLKENRNCRVLYVQTESASLTRVIRQVAKDSGISSEIRVVADCSEVEENVDAILIHHFDAKGELKDWGQQNYHDFFGCLLNRTGFMLPRKIFLIGQLVYSADLLRMVEVKDENVQGTSFGTSSSGCGQSSDEEGGSDHKSNTDLDYNNRFLIADYINQFKINQVFDLNSTLYEYTPSTQMQTLIQIDETGTTECVINFGKIEVTKSKPAPNALICWYEIHLTPDHIHSTRRDDSFMNHTAVIFEEELKKVISQDKEVRVRIFQMKGLVKATVLV